MVNAAMAICSLRYVMTWYTMENQDDPRRHSKEECTSELRIKGHKRIKKVESAPNIRVPGGNILCGLSHIMADFRQIIWRKFLQNLCKYSTMTQKVLPHNMA